MELTVCPPTSAQCLPINCPTYVFQMSAQHLPNVCQMSAICPQCLPNVPDRCLHQNVPDICQMSFSVKFWISSNIFIHSVTAYRWHEHTQLYFHEDKLDDQ